MTLYTLKQVKEFDGDHTVTTPQGTIGRGAGATAMHNQAGVVIKLVSTAQGIDFKVAASAIKIVLK